jgi:hypothetical protein
MKRLFGKIVFWLACLAGVFAILIVLVYVEEDWRGAHDWAVCQRDLTARGESLDLQQLSPLGKPEDDLSKVPIFAELYSDGAWDKARIHKLRADLNTANASQIPKADYRKAEPVDLAAWQKFYRSEPSSNLSANSSTPAQDVLQVLGRFDPDLAEIDTAISGPGAYFPIDYKMPYATPSSGVTSMIPVAQILQLRGAAHLENHETDLAEKDYLFSVRLCQPLAKGCFLVNFLVIGGVRTIDDSVLWNGLRQHAWNDAQLHEMESALASTDMLSLAVSTLRNERGSFLKTVDVAQTVDTNISRNLKTGRFLGLLEYSILRPIGWWDQDRVTYSLTAQKWIDGIDLNQELLHSSAFPQHPLAGYIDDNGATDTPLWIKLYTPLSAASIPSLENDGPGFARAETYRRLARLACRLEEYRIAQGQYPEKLDDLPDLPLHLNQEVLDNQPLHYQRRAGTYSLYSLGWRQKDDGGQFSSDPQQGNWPWPSP